MIHYVRFTCIPRTCLSFFPQASIINKAKKFEDKKGDKLKANLVNFIPAPTLCYLGVKALKNTICSNANIK